MFKQTLLKLHRWLTLIFALPLAVVIVTGMIFAFEPLLVQNATAKGEITLEKVQKAFADFDKEGKTRALSYSALTKTLTLVGVGEEGETEVNLLTGEEVEKENWLENLLRESKSIHQHLVYDLGWLVTASTFAMMGLIILGIFMGLPRLRNSLSGWHKGIAWFGLPLLILSPLTGLFLAYKVSFTTPQAREVAKPVTLLEAVDIVSKTKDLSGLIWIRMPGGRPVARMNDNGAYKTFGISHEKGVVEGQRNWVRLLHEGNWNTYLASLLNILVSFAFITLLITGLWMWVRRTFRKKSLKV
jgi:uncharacterized iron-regulated membrane protein